MNHRDLDPLDRPLFGGGPTSTDRMVNLVVGTLTVVMVVVTVVLAIVYYSKPRAGVNIFFAIVILFICGSHILLIYWYRQGDLDPKFRRMIFYNAFTLVLLCVAGNLYINNVSTTCTS
uniref:Transmembrane protein 243 n=1 Tax=Arion vulgaris TaxID=1028688 RepID=A0A0B6ZZ34_9EUPU